MKIKLLVFLSLFCGISIFSQDAFGLVKRSRKPKKTITYVSKGVKTSVRFRPDRLGVYLTFSNFDNVESVRYELVYETNGVQQAAGGSVMPGDTETKTLLFASCSGPVCTFHENVTNARLSVISTLKDGTTVLKPFVLRV